jgi:hypothetical protein
MRTVRHGCARGERTLRISSSAALRMFGFGSSVVVNRFESIWRSIAPGYLAVPLEKPVAHTERSTVRFLGGFLGTEGRTWAEEEGARPKFRR